MNTEPGLTTSSSGSLSRSAQNIMASQTPRRLRRSDRTNFNTLLRASAASALALVSAIRRADRKHVALVCAMQTNADQTITPVPFAVMVEGNPFELFDDPTVMKGGR